MVLADHRASCNLLLGLHDQLYLHVLKTLLLERARAERPGI